MTTASATTQNALAATPTALRSDLAFIATLSAENLGAFCVAARAMLKDPDDDTAHRKAARMLGVDTSVVAAAVTALCHVFVNAAIAGRAANDVLHGFDDLNLSEEALAALATFYSEAMPELEQELRSGLELPRFRALEWRLQVKLAGRYAPRQAPQPSFLLRLHTQGGAHGTGEEHLLQADVTSLRRLTSELEAALAEDKSSHARRIARRV